MNITKSTTLDTIMNAKEFESFGDKLFIPWVGPFELVHKLLPIGAVDQNAPHTEIMSGIQRLLELRQSGEPVYHPIDAEKKQWIFHFPGRQGGKCVFICPGGGYGTVCSLWEGFPIAARLNSMGFHAVVVNYRVGREAHYPNPQDDLAAAVRFTMEHANVWGIDCSEYAVEGSSAGGHLAGSFCTQSVGYPLYGLPSPGCAILAYPVVTMGEAAHRDSRKRLLGAGRSDPELRALYSIEAQIIPQYPKTFLWQCVGDNVVPFANSQRMKKALDACGVHNCYMTFEGNAHGWGLGTGTAAEGWLEAAVDFWQRTEP